MGTRAFDNFSESIKAEIDIQVNTVAFLKKSIQYCTDKPQLSAKQRDNEETLLKTNVKIKDLKDFSNTMQRDWSDPKNRIIGHVVWAPPISGSTPPHGYTKDVCVIKLDRGRFWPDFVQNAINLGAC